MPVRLRFAILALALTRLLHWRVVWVEEAYPSAAAINVLAGRLPYRDFWFDKPPLTAWLYALWQGGDGVGLRLAGAAYLALCCWLLYRLTKSELAAAFLGFFLVFAPPAAGLVLGPDMLTIAPVLGALCVRDRPLLAGAILGIGFQCNTKALLFLPVLLTRVADWPAMLGFALVAAPAFALPGYFEQVWQWGSLYARDSFVENPLREGVVKTAAWLGFAATLVIASLRARWDRMLVFWMLAALACSVAGFRFFPRYYFHLLPPLAIAAARGWPNWGRWRWLVLMPMLLPLVRYAPSYYLPERSRDLAMFRDAKEAARIVSELAGPTDTIFVWGYRPEIDMLTRLPGGTPFLESQPLTGVFADRHLTNSRPTASPEFTAAQRARLTASRPTFVVDGLGRYNATLAIDQYADLRDWLARYEVVALTTGTKIYRRRER